MLSLQSQVQERKQRQHLCRVLRQIAIVHLDVAELVFACPKWAFSSACRLALACSQRCARFNSCLFLICFSFEGFPAIR